MLLKKHIYSPFILTSVIILFSFSSKSQVISQFNWNSNPITTAVTGPNAISAGATATSSPGGVGGTNGLNPGAPTASDINLTIPNTGNVFDVPNVDISIDYRRNESTAQMVKRGTFTFNTGGSIANFRVTYRVANGSTITTVASTAVAIPNDATFRTYRFTYDNCSGIATTYVNTTVVWTNSATPTPGQNLYWVGDGNVVIGQDMDGANNNIPNLDNFIWQTYTCTSALPIELLVFTGTNEGSKNYFEWSTATEKNNDYFTLEKSENAIDWLPVVKVYGAGNSNTKKNYTTYDLNPEKKLNYYRLTQTDFDGEQKKHEIIVVDNSYSSNLEVLKITDLLGREINSDFVGPYIIYYSDGSVKKQIRN
jgi:hypothetical protein